MKDKRDIAVGATPDAPAAATREERRPAAAVEQDDGLLAAAGDRSRASRVRLVQRPLLLGHPEQLDARERAAVDPLGEAHTLERDEALGPRRRRAR